MTEIVVVDSIASAVLNMGAFFFSFALATVLWIILVAVDPIEDPSDNYYIFVSSVSHNQRLLRIALTLPLRAFVEVGRLRQRR